MGFQGTEGDGSGPWAGYFDGNATTPLGEAARRAWLEASEGAWFNPSSPYRAAARAHGALEVARQQVAAWMGDREGAQRVVFTSGATEACGAVVRHFAEREPGGEVWVSAGEHPCVREAARRWAGGRCRELPLTPAGGLDLAAFEGAWAEAVSGGRRPALVAVMAVNNETGVMQPWAAAARQCAAAAVPFLCDASQWLGKRPVAELAAVSQELAHAPFLVGCGHKFGGPKGVGWVRLGGDHAGLQLQPGGEQEGGHRGGTENFPGIASMVAALAAAEEGLAAQRAAWRAGREVLEGRILAELPETVILGREAERLDNTSALLLPKFTNTRWVAQLDRRGFAVSTGSACATGHEGPSHVLSAMGVSAEAARRAVRVSAWQGQRIEDWRALAEAMIAAYREMNTGGAGSSAVISLE